MKILVTGSSGMVGRALDCAAKPFDHSYYSMPNHGPNFDLRDSITTMNMVSRAAPDAVVHLAARVGGIQANMRNQESFLTDNLCMNTSIIGAAVACHVKRLIAIGSTCIFPAGAPQPLCVEDLHEGTPHPTNYGYAFAKRMMVVHCGAVNERPDYYYQVVIPCNLYGPHDNFHLDNSHVIPAIIHKMYLAMSRGEDLHLIGSGNAVREFMFSRDFANVLVRLIDVPDKTPLIVRPPICTACIGEVAEMIRDAMKFEGQIIFDGGPDGIMRKDSNNSEFMRRYGNDMTFTSLPKGIRETVQWFLKHYREVRK